MNTFNFFINIEFDTKVNVRESDVNESQTITHKTIALFGFDRINGLIAMDNVNGSHLYIEGINGTFDSIKEVSGTGPLRFDYDGFGIGSNELPFDFARLAFWRLDHVPSNIILPNIRGKFYNLVSKAIVAPTISRSLLGVPLIDVYGSAVQINQGIDQSGNNNNFIMSGNVTDVP